MVFKATVLVALIALWGVSARPQLKQTFSHEGVGYALLNHTLQPVPDGCTITSPGQVASVVSSCRDIHVGSFSVPAASQPLIFDLLQGTTLTFTGHLDFQKHDYSGLLIQIRGNGVMVQGTSTHLLHGHGELYWDGKGGAGCVKPTFMYLNGIGSTFNGLMLKNCPERCVAIDGGNDITVSSFLIDNREGARGVAPPGREGHNTDAFDVDKTQYLTLKNSVVYNQDDCVAINSGAHIVVDQVNCDGSHGFDIATGMSTTDEKLNIVNNITFKNSKLYNGVYGLHILTCNDGGKGYVNNINYEHIEINGACDYGIMIQQDFSNSGQGSSDHPTGNVPISNVHFNDVTGFMNGLYSYALSIRCAAGACNNIVIPSNVRITGAKSKNECWNYHVNGWC